MTAITVTKKPDGKLGGLTEKDRRAYARFKSVIDGLEIGELFTLEYWFPRESWRHRQHMALVRAIFNAQERFEDDTQFRKWLEIGAGFCDWAPGPRGGIVPVPKSIAYDRLDDEGLADLHEKTKAFLLSAHCQRALWRHLDETRRAEMAAAILMSFEGGDA